MDGGRVGERDLLPAAAVAVPVGTRLWAIRYNQAEKGTPRSV